MELKLISHNLQRSPLGIFIQSPTSDNSFTLKAACQDTEFDSYFRGKVGQGSVLCRSSIETLEFCPNCNILFCNLQFKSIEAKTKLHFHAFSGITIMIIITTEYSVFTPIDRPHERAVFLTLSKSGP